MVLTTSDMKDSGSEDEEDDENNLSEETRDSLIQKLKKLSSELKSQKIKLIEQEVIIQDLTADLKREKRINDIMIDQVASVRSLQREAAPVDLKVLSDSEDEETGTPNSPPLTAAQRQRTPLPADTSRSGVYGDTQHPPDADIESQGKTPTRPEASQGDKKEDDTQSNPQGDEEQLAQIHPRCLKPAKRLSYVLNSFKNLPVNRTTILIGASNFRGIKDELDPNKKNTAVRAISGLCVVGAAQALKRYKYSYPGVKNIVWFLGINDQLHENDHCPGDWDSHFSTLINETTRIFKNAKIHFISPLLGLPRIPQKYRKKIGDLLESKFPNVRRHSAPSMEGKVRNDGIHINFEGAKSLRNFLVKRFTTYKPISDSPVDRQQSNHAAVDYNARTTRGYDRSFGDTAGVNHNASDPVRGNNHLYNGCPPSFNSNYGAVGLADNVSSEFPPLPGSAQPPHMPQRMRQVHQMDPIKDLSEALASAILVHMNRRM